MSWANSDIMQVLPKSALVKALNYALSNRSMLETYLQSGYCSLSNNLAENSIRPFIIGRKKWLFSGSPKGAKASAAVYSLIETCKANGIAPQAYLEYLLTRLPQDDLKLHSEHIKEYMP